MNDDTPLLCRCYGTAEALYWLPLLRPLGDTLHRVGAWQAAYRRRGLAFGTDRQTTEALRRLTNAGQLSAGGQTQGKAWKLTDAGVMAAMRALDLDPAESKSLLVQIAVAEDRSTVCLPGSCYRLAMAWQIIPTAGAWLGKASRSAKTWGAYQDRLNALAARMAPLLVLGMAHLFTDGQGHLWGVKVTPEGRAALGAWPAAPAAMAADKEACFAAWEEGFDTGVEYAAKPPPPGYDNVVTCRLPASEWTATRGARHE